MSQAWGLKGPSREPCKMRLSFDRPNSPHGSMHVSILGGLPKFSPSDRCQRCGAGLRPEKPGGRPCTCFLAALVEKLLPGLRLRIWSATITSECSVKFTGTGGPRRALSR